MFSSIRKSALTVGALGALGLGGAAVAGAAGTSPSPTPTQTSPGHPPRGDELTGDTAAKVKAAALAKVPGAAVLRTESGGPYNSAYHAHIKTSDGKLEVVLVDSSFNAAAVQADQGRSGPGGRGGHHGGAGETPLTGDTKDKVEAAVLAKYPGAKIVRTETNSDGSAPYESHIETSAGKQLEVHVSKDFKVLDALERPAHP